MTLKHDAVFMMTSVHYWDDPRIFYKEAVSLAKKYRVELHAPADFISSEKNNVLIYGLPCYKKRYLRPLNWIRLLVRAWRSAARIIHFHDPELIPIGLILKRFAGKKVIYDVHENLPASLVNKAWIPKIFSSFLAKAFDLLEKKAAQYFDGVILAELSYRDRFSGLPVRMEPVLNYPLTDLISETDGRIWEKGYGDLTFIYAGVISEIRGIREIIFSFAQVKKRGYNFHLYLVGAWVPASLEPEIKKLIRDYDLESNVTITGRVPLEIVYGLYGASHIGLALLYPEKNYLDSLATKIYEYMAAGLAVIASDFPLWKQLVEETRCGITVNPRDIDAVSRVMVELVEKKSLRESLGKNGMEAVGLFYNWKTQEEKLWTLYQEWGGIQ
ncbi:MAG: glycosyltransferase family 4 protein [Bacillota bacterium]|jgi:glycosyltransferase involved in cell wall biosynthesis